MKKLVVLILASVMLLTGCGLRVAIDAASSVLETAPELERVETSTFLIHRITVEYADGREEKQVFDFDDRNYPASCEYYVNGELTGTDTYTVDEYGNILTATPDYADGEQRTYVYTYDENGNILAEESYLDGSLDYTAECTYNESGILIQKVFLNADGPYAQYHYDAQGRETEHLYYDADVLQSRTVTEYADHGKRLKVTGFSSDGQVIWWEDYSFDQKSSKETILEYSAEGELLQKRIVTYDTHDNPMMEEVYQPDGTLISTTYRHIVQHKHIDYVEVTEPNE